jgi:hypothetical protein
MQWEYLEFHTKLVAGFKQFDTESLHGPPRNLTSAAENVETAELF